ARTVSVWAQSNYNYLSAGNAGGIWNWGSSSGTGTRFGMVISPNDNHDYFVGEFEDLDGVYNLTDGKWHNIIVAFDGTTVTVWVDAFYSRSGALPLSTTLQALEIGRSSVDHGVAEPFTGNLDDLRIYDRVLTEDERGELFFEGGWH
ncbi:MAG: LamG domain-containing protein, partial [Polyangiales bacterium]